VEEEEGEDIQRVARPVSREQMRDIWKRESRRYDRALLSHETASATP
jgi:hypothetical protein